MSVNQILVQADKLAAASNRSQLLGSYAIAAMYRHKALLLRRRAHKIGVLAEDEQSLWDIVSERGRDYAR